MSDGAFIEASIAAQATIALLHDQVELLFRYAPQEARRPVQVALGKLTEARLWMGEAGAQFAGYPDAST